MLLRGFVADPDVGRGLESHGAQHRRPQEHLGCVRVQHGHPLCTRRSPTFRDHRSAGGFLELPEPLAHFGEALLLLRISGEIVFLARVGLEVEELSRSCSGQ